MLDAMNGAAPVSMPIVADGPVAIRSQKDFLDAIRARIDRLNVSREAVDELCGFAPRYANKLLSPTPIKRAGVGAWLQLARGLGCVLHLVEDPAATAQIRAEVEPRKF